MENELEYLKGHGERDPNVKPMDIYSRGHIPTMQQCLSPSDSLSSHDSSAPYAPSDSPGSSVSTRLKDEYDELLKYAVVVPTFDTSRLPQSLADFRGSFPRGHPIQNLQPVACHEGHHPQDEEDSGTEIGDGMSQVGEDVADGGVREAAGDKTPRRRALSPVCTPPPADEAAPQTFRDAFRQPATPDSPRSQVSVAGGTTAFSLTVDQDIVRMEGLMSTWLGDLNRNVLAEFGQSKIRMLEHYKHLLQKEKEKHAADMNRLQNETEGLKELLLTYEQSIERKDEVIANLTRAMQRQCDKFEMAKTFCEWKIRHNDKKREAFATNLAERHYQRVLAQKVWSGWHSLVESRWKQRVEKACQAKAQEVCMSLTNDYETRLASLNEALEAARVEVSRLHTERERYEETMKKAFMRGVCALNLEAMTMFHGDEEGTPGEADGQAEVPDVPPVTIPQESVYTAEPQAAPSPRVITSTGATSSRSSLSQASSRSTTSISSRTKAGQKGKVISAKLSARSDGVSRSSAGSNVPLGLAPPMSSVIVERHQPVTKATIGKATASQFPQGAPPSAAIVQRRIAGQPKHGPIASPNIQTIKMVE